MKRLVLAVMVAMVMLVAQPSWAHQPYVKKNPTNENGIEFGVDNAAGFVRWRAYIKGLSNNSQGLNSGWKYANGWWYYDLDSMSKRVMWRLDGIANQKFVITYWVFRSDGTWDYGPQLDVVSDQVVPNAWFANLANGQSINQASYNIQVGSSDNLSGVDKIRIYVVIPAGLSLPSYWLPSGISNQYYLEFDFTSFVHQFNFPGAGNYQFTLWVKDKAGNIAYEPGGQINVTVTSGSNPPPPPPDPEPQPPAGPSKLTLTEQKNTVVLTWQDNANNEEGFLIYKNSQYLAKLPANTVTYTDSNLAYGQNYCYRVLAFIGSLNSVAVESCIYLEEPVVNNKYANGFIYPMSCDYVYRFEPDSQIPIGACYDYQPFCSFFNYPDRPHLGCDLNYRGKEDFGAPVYAISNALIWKIGWTSGWGNYLILQINAAPGDYFRLSNGNKTTQIYVLYAHLDQIFVINGENQRIEKNKLVEKQTYVGQGWQVGTVGDGNGLYKPHLHFEIRINGYDKLGPGYWPANDLDYLNYFVDPIEFIENNWVDNSRFPLTLYVHGYDRLPEHSVYANLDPSVWQRQGRVYGNTPLAPVGWANHIWLVNSKSQQVAAWEFEVPITGSWSVYATIPRYYAQATNATYQVWHDSSGQALPAVKIIDQTNNDVNKEVLLGQFEFYTGKNYKVDLLSQPYKQTAFDTLILVFEGDPGSGGGNSDQGQVKKIFSDGTLTFKYSGTYSRPELHCFGGGLDWNKLILQNGLLEKTVNVFSSEKVYCNIRFEDNEWLANWQGLLAGQKLFVNGQEITALADNGYGGYNLVFDLVIDDIDNNPPTDPKPGGNGSGKSSSGGSSSGGGGCHISADIPPLAGAINYLIALLPAGFIYGWRLTKKK